MFSMMYIAVSAAVTPVTELDNVDSQPHITSNQLIIILTCTGFLVILLTVNLMIVSIGIIYWKHAHVSSCVNDR